MKQISVHSENRIDTKSGFCRFNSTFYSKRQSVAFPVNHSLDVTTFISSLPHHGKVAYIDSVTGNHLTFSDVWYAVNSVSSFLSDMGIRKGDVILLLSPNSIFFPIICLSVMLIGAIITTANPLNTHQEISKQIVKSKVVLAFTIQQLLPKFSNNIPVVLMEKNNSDSPTVNNGVKIIGELHKIIEKHQPQEECYSSLRERVTQDDIAMLLFSSGTTGEGKAVMTTHGNLIAATEISIGRFRTHEPNQIYLASIPMFHAYGLLTFVFRLLAKGCTMVIMKKFNMHDMLGCIQKYKVTYLPVVPPIIVSLLNDADEFKKLYELKSLRYILISGASLSKQVREEVEEKFPDITLFQAYTMTEANGAGADMDNPNDCRRFGSVGLLTPNTEAKIVDPDTGEALSVNRSGELWLRGPTVMKGYLNNEEANAASIVLPGGWLRTGDICYVDDHGFLFVIDRIKELIKYNGHQVAPAELEALLLSHPEITDAVVIPFPDKKVGQYPMAYVVPKRGSSLSEIAIIEFVAKQVAPYKKVRRVAFLNNIPRNALGKILRRDLVNLATSKM